MICCSTDASRETAKAVRIPLEASVKALAAEFRRRRDEILPIVRHYDQYRRRISSILAGTAHRRGCKSNDTVGVHVHPAGRLAEHEGAVERPARSRPRGPALAIVAACQVASLDAGTNEATVARYAGHFGRDAAWVSAVLATLRGHGAVLPGGVLRCRHIMAAVRIIKETLSDHVDASFWQFVAVLRQLVRDSIGNPRGISWLVEDSQVMALGFYQEPSQPLTLYSELVDSIVAFCMQQTHSIERRDAGFLLNRLIAHRVLSPDRLRPHFPVLARWVEAADGQNAGAIAWAVNNLYNESKTDAAELVEFVDPATITAHLAGARAGCIRMGISPRPAVAGSNAGVARPTESSAAAGGNRITHRPIPARGSRGPFRAAAEYRGDRPGLRREVPLPRGRGVVARVLRDPVECAHGNA